MTLRTWLKRRSRDPGPAATRGAPAWFAPAAEAMADLLGDDAPRTIWCIANSEAVPVDEVRGRLDPARDLLCQYNLCQHAPAFADPALTSIFFFHMTERGPIHGIAADGTPRADLTAFGPGSRACYLRSGFSGDHVPPAIGIPAFTLDTQRLHGLFHHSRPGVIPSAGFASTLLFHLVNLRRALDGKPPHPIVLCGFTGEYPNGGAFIGHDFHSERAALAALPNVSHLRSGPVAPATPSRLHHDLAAVFHPGYDGHKRGKAEMLFDIAKLHLAAGDLPAFVDFTRMSVGVNPGFYPLSWLVRTIGTTPGDAATPAMAALDGLSHSLDRLRDSWATSEATDLGGAPFPSDFAHPQAAYVSAGGGAPRVLIVNETSKLAFNKWHLGCDLVSRALVDGLTGRGLECAGWVNGLAGLNRVLEHDPEARFDGVVINGEGTLHHNADRAFEIATIGAYLKGLGKRVFLVNSVWQGNGPRIEALVRDFDLVTVRESFSAEALAPVRADVRLVPDLCWSAGLARPPGPAGPVAVLDCVEPQRTARLERIARAAGLPFFVMDRFFEAFHRALRAASVPEATPRVLHRADVGAPAGWLGGRFHGVVLALGAGVPILSTPSNTNKVQAMLADIGLKGKLLTGPVLDGLRDRAEVEALFSAGPGAYTAADWAKVADYQARARAEIDRLFADIAANLG
jgi:hypothetical protein